MKRFLYTLALLLPMHWVMAQAEFGLPYLPQVFQSQQSNPALLSPFKINVALPSPYVNIANSGFTANQLLSPLPGTDSLMVDLDDVLARLGSQNYVRANVHVDLLGLGIHIRNLQITANVATRANLYLNYPRQLVDLAVQGNAAFLGEELEVAPDIAAFAYTEIAVGAAYRFFDRLTIGTRLKYLNGIGNLDAGTRSIRFRTNPEYYQLEADVEYQMQTSVFDVGSLDNFEPQFEPQPMSANTGFAVDLGATFEVGKRLDISASVLDIGFINWTDQAKSYQARGKVSFDGLDLAAILTGDSTQVDKLLDSLKNSLDITETAGAYRTILPRQMMASVRFSPLKKLHLQGLVYNEQYRGQNYPGLSLGVSKDFGRWFTLGAAYNVRHRSYNQLGIQAYLKLGPIATFLIVDNVLAPVFPMSSKYTSFRAGMNVSIGKNKLEELAPKDR